ncbi:UNVERIFIED_CONTAM: hypothetical protein O8I53_11620 [Campylobacter lari]
METINKIGINFINDGIGKFTDVTNSKLSMIFKSDNPKYEINENGRIDATNDNYTIDIKSDADSITYGSSGKYNIYYYKNGDSLINQDTKLIFKGNEIHPS